MVPSIGEELFSGQELPSVEELSELTREVMGRSANTVNYSGQLPLAQGMGFTI